MSLIQVDTSKIEALGARLAGVDSESLGKASMRALNVVVNRGFELGVRTMLTGVNLTESYVKERMTVEEATDPNKPVAKIIAFRPGGQRKSGIKPVNLRQYDPKLGLTFTNWRNTGVARNSGKKVFRPVGEANRKQGTGPNKAGTSYYENPRKPGSKLPFYPRVGNRVLAIPVGQKVESISVEVVRGRRKMLKPVNGFKAFMQRMPNGEVLVMRRTTKNGGKDNKGKIEALYSLSVAQLFQFIAKRENDKARKFKDAILADLETTVAGEIIEEIQQAVNQ
jgi:hypothetical protein